MSKRAWEPGFGANAFVTTRKGPAESGWSNFEETPIYVRPWIDLIVTPWKPDSKCFSINKPCGRRGSGGVEDPHTRRPTGRDCHSCAAGAARRAQRFFPESEIAIIGRPLRRRNIYRRSRDLPINSSRTIPNGLHTVFRPPSGLAPELERRVRRGFCCLQNPSTPRGLAWRAIFLGTNRLCPRTPQLLS